ncbi:MAG TPA: HD domain-containing phosphohydrolase [Candidatus Bilamarchaeaceae archaeon]|nr:HD domain-containing phosphohydrolase [Candidatus Bilamarchaeaceae archaeon]
MLLRKPDGMWHGTPLHLAEAMAVRVPGTLLPARIFRRYMERYTDRRLDATLERLHKNKRTEFQDWSELSRLIAHLFREPLGEGIRLPYTYRHSDEVKLFAYILFSELLAANLLPPQLPSPRALASSAGIAHDNGKYLLRRGLLGLAEKMDVHLWGRWPVWPGRDATDLERDIIRKGHLDAGKRLLDALSFEGKERIIGMVECHHINFDGRSYPDSSSYPENIAGRDLPIEKRIMKLCDAMSAVLPRFYRERNVVQTLEEATALMIAAAGREVDPLLVAHLAHGIYTVPVMAMDELLGFSRLLQSSGSESSTILPYILDHPVYLQHIHRSRRGKLEAYQRELQQTDVRTDSDLAYASRVHHAYSSAPLVFP